MRSICFALLVAAACSSWVMERPGLATIAIGISCATEDVCFVGGTQSGVGSVAFKTTNGGRSYEPVDLEDGPQLLYLTAVALDERRAFLGGMGWFINGQFTVDGQHFRNTQSFPLIALAVHARRVRNTRDVIGMPGYFTTEDSASIAISTNAGMNWTLYHTGRPSLETLRWGAFPTMTTWYIAGGQQSRNSKDSTQIGRITLHHEDLKNVRASFAVNHTSKQILAHDNKVSHVAVIIRTRDGGRTFQRVFYEEDMGYYLNAMDCPNERTCFVVGEGPAGARIMASRDGGDTWEIVWRPSQSTYDMVGLEFLSDNEGWACGMRHDTLTAVFLHTRDGGRTWAESYGPETTVCFSINFPSQRKGRGMVLEVFGQASGVVVYNAP